MLAVQNITFFISNRCLFKNLNLQANPGDRIGLVGPNGAGKTTLLRLITGKFTPEGGQVTWPSDTSVGYLEQEVLEVNVDQSIKNLAMMAFEEANRLEKEIIKLGNQIAETTDFLSEDYQKLLDKIEKAQTRYDMLEGDKKESKTEEMLEGLGFRTEDLDEPVAKFSGGWRMRALLAKLLLQRPDILLLDEPTNHLDIDSIEWLEKYLQAYHGAVILVSHDQFFLNRMVNRIAELRNSRIFTYTGNYDQYLEQRAEQIELQTKVYEAQQREIAQTERFIERFKAKATKAKQAQSRMKSLEKLERVEAPEDSQAEMSFKFAEPPHSGKIVLEIQNLKKTYPGIGDSSPVPVFTEGQHLEIQRGDKIALIGTNGAGKSTLARIINGNEPFEGQLKNGHKVHQTFFAQHLADVLESDRTVLDETMSSAPTSEARSNVRNILGCFLFTGDDVFKPISVLSGGERSRLALAKTLLQPANFLILDEPTNHLDIQSKNVLLQALKDYKGTVLAVSHDRHFLAEFASTVWRVEDGQVSIYDGGYNYYEWKRKEQLEASNGQKSISKTNSNGNGVQNNGLNKKQAKAARGPKTKEQKRLEAQLRSKSGGDNGAGPNHVKKKVMEYEREIERLDARKAELEKMLSDTAFYEKPEAAECIREHAEIEKKSSALFSKWEEASEQLEAM
ncbi:MAG: ABC-F family ATP-binding cassette domain-containing protein [Balneolales bacterium]